MTNIQKDLFSMQDSGYQAFQSKLIPTLDPQKMIGIRTPVLRAYARKFAKSEEASTFLAALPHEYFEENNLHSFLLEGMKEFDAAVKGIDAFLPYVDNWATCDSMKPGVFRKHRQELLPYIRRWLASEHTYTIRYGIGMLMTHYLDDAFSPDYLDWVAALRSDEYYVNMMIAWYFATALAKQYDAALPCLLDNRLALWTHNKTIQKAVESDRITPEQKTYLRTLKRREKRV